MKSIILFAVAMTAFPVLANSQVLVGYHDPIFTYSGVTAGPIDDTGSSAGVNFESQTTPTGTFPLLYDIVTVRPGAGSISESTAVSNDSYFQFNVGAVPGLALSLSSLDFGGYKGGASDPRGWVLRSSVDGFAADISSGVITADPFDSGSTAPDEFSVDLSAGAYQGLSDITLRLYAYVPTADFALNFTNIELKGSVIPEPSHALLSLIGIAAIALRRRRN